MFHKTAILSMLACLVMTPFVFADSLSVTPFSLQVASFPEQAVAQEFAATLVHQGFESALDTVRLPGRGNWTRVFVGRFKSASEAQKYGQKLLARGLIKEFL